jgi:rod shape-determining protein MreB
MSKQRIWAVGGGKGGVGKSLVAANLAVVLANMGNKVIAVDLDLGNANMHTYLGIRYPRRTIVDFINGNVQDLGELLLDTSIFDLKFISGSGGIVGAANPGHAQKLKLLRYLERLRVDHIVLDLGAGTAYNTIDFFLGATDHIIITTPETPAVQSAYNFIRICLFRILYSVATRSAATRKILEHAKIPAPGGKVQSIHEIISEIEKVAPECIEGFRNFQRRFKPNLVVNMVLKDEESRVGRGIREVVKRFLDIELDYVGSISFDRIIRDSVTAEIPFILNHPNAKPSNEFYSVAARLLNSGEEARIREILQREIRRVGKTYSERVVQARAMEVDPSVYIADRVKNHESGVKKESSLFNFRSTSWSKIAIDLGTSAIRLFVKGRGVILTEPSLLSVEEGTGKVVAVGRDSKAMLGRSHSGISIIAPMEAGAISDYTDVKRMVNEFMRIAKRSSILIRPGVILTIPPKLTAVEKRAVREFVKDLGAREVHLVFEPLAAAIGAGLPVDVPSASMVVNIGAGAVSAAVVSIGGIVTMASERTGGKSVDTAIVRHLREKHSFLIGDQTAEWVKIHFGQAVKAGRDRRVEIRGQNLDRSVPGILTISTTELREAIAKPVEDTIRVIMRLLERVPPELSGDLVDRGMILTGGGALLDGLDLLIRDRTGIPVRIAPNALTAAVEGAGRMLEDFSLYRKFFVETADENGSLEKNSE